MPVSVTLGGTAISTAVPSFRVKDINRGVRADTRDVAVTVPGRAGSWTFTEDPGDRIITVSGFIAADGTAARRAAMQALAGWLGSGTASLVFGDESDRYYAVVLENGGNVNEALRYGEVELEWRAQPYAFATSPTVQTISVTGSGSSSGSFSISDAISAEPVIEITPTNGTLTGFTLTVNGRTVGWASPPTIASGDTITVSSLSDTVTVGINSDVNLTGAFNPNDVSMLSVTVSALGFPELVSGSNAWSLAWTGTATAITLKFTWRKRFL